jgi:hypothetical protein
MPILNTGLLLSWSVILKPFVERDAAFPAEFCYNRVSPKQALLRGLIAERSRMGELPCFA